MAVALSVAWTERDVERFRKYTRRDEQTGCLLWTGKWQANGYGCMKVAGRRWLAHRLAWLFSGRAIPAATTFVLHDCPSGDNPLCCEISHLKLGTHTENGYDKAIKDRARRSTRDMPRGVQPRIGRRGQTTYMACIYSHVVNRKFRRFHLGDYATISEAAEVAAAARELRALIPHLFSIHCHVPRSSQKRLP